MSNVQDSPAYYEDVRRVMDIALERDGLIYELDSIGKAIHFRQKCYRYRNFLRDLDQERSLGVPGIRPATKYDTLTIVMVNKKEGEKQSRFLKFNHAALSGNLIDPETGQTIQVDFTPDDNEGGNVV